jgi:hypothetical protein
MERQQYVEMELPSTPEELDAEITALQVRLEYLLNYRGYVERWELNNREQIRLEDIIPSQ